jgi:hypothetical protein
LSLELRILLQHCLWVIGFCIAEALHEGTRCSSSANAKKVVLWYLGHIVLSVRHRFCLPSPWLRPLCPRFRRASVTFVTCVFATILA